MGAFIDLRGKRFGRLLVVERNGSTKQKGAVWLCQCDCGKQKNITAANLSTGNSLSCGCLASELSSARHFKHGKVKTPTYYSWVNMLKRSTSPSHKDGQHYKRNKITVCKEWETFSTFLKDMGEKPKGYYLDRINNLLGYYKENCKWSSPKESAKNKTSSKIWIYNGVEYSSLEEAAIALNISIAIAQRSFKGRMCRGKFLKPYDGFTWRYKYGHKDNK